MGSFAEDDAESTAVSARGSEDWWPPLSYAENDHILVWWLPEYDEVLRELVADYQWAWQGGVLERLEPLIPAGVLRAWRDSDPQCQEYSWYNVLGTFAAARAKQLGIVPRPARQKVCSCCSRTFLESDLSYRLITRTGIDQIDVCHVCLSQALQEKGSPTSSAEDIIAVLQALSEVLGRPPKTTDLAGRLDLRDLTHEQRVVVVQALRIKPTPARIKELFGSWKDAVAQAAAAAPVLLPRYQTPPRSAPARSEFTSSDPGRYRALTGPLPEITLDAGRDELDYYEEIRSLIGAGYLALAEAALVKLCERECVMNFPGLLAEVYGQTARKDQARAAMRAAYQSPAADLDERYLDSVFWPRDMRTITSGPVFYEPLRLLPRGEVCFVLVGGPMQYVDRRGEHSCISGEAPPGGAAAGLAESVARMSAMVDGEPWMQAAAATGQAIITSLARARDASGLYGQLISYATSPFRAIVKALTGSLPGKIAENAWTLAPAGKSRWSYQREAAQYLFNASAGFALMTVQTAPTVCIWGWPDRSDGCLQAFLDTVAAGRPGPVFAILPDVPAYRDFARRYACKERPTAANVAQLALRLCVDPGFFAVRPDDVAALSTTPHFRSLRSTSQLARDQAFAYGQIAVDIAQTLERHVEFPEPDVPSFPVSVDDQEGDGPERAARLARGQWGLAIGPVGHLVRLLENHGVLVVFSPPQTAAVDAYSFDSRLRPVVVLNPIKRDYYRQRFDLAHELGHLIMHSDAEPGGKIVEDQAHRFAAELLMPVAEIHHQLPVAMGGGAWPMLGKLKEQWGVSIQALLFHARRLGRLSDVSYRNAMTTISARGWRRDEPGLVNTIEQPSLLPKAVELLAGAGIDEPLLIEQCRVPPELFRIVTARTPDAPVPREAHPEQIGVSGDRHVISLLIRAPASIWPGRLNSFALPRDDRLAR